MISILNILPKYNPQKPIIRISTNLTNNPHNPITIQHQTTNFSFRINNAIPRLFINIISITYTKMWSILHNVNRGILLDFFTW